MTRLRRLISTIALLAPSCSFALDCRYESAPDANYGRNYAAFAQWCEACGGEPYRVNGIGCNPGPDWGHPARSVAPATNDTSNTSAAKAEADRQSAAAEKQRQFLSERDNALHSLKGVTPTTGGTVKLKGATDGFSTQLKSAGAKVEGTTLKTAPTTKVAAPSGVWKQILCAHGLAKTAMDAANRGDAEEAGFLLDESALAVSGGTLSVDCPETALPKGFHGEPPTGVAMTAFYGKLKEKTVREARLIAAADAAKPDLQKKLKQAQAAAAKASSKPSPGPKAAGTDIDRAREEQRRINEARSKEFDDLKKKQAELNKANDDELAFLREAQKLLNEQNAKKAKAQESVKAMDALSTTALSDPKAAMAALDKIQ